MRVPPTINRLPGLTNTLGLLLGLGGLLQYLGVIAYLSSHATPGIDSLALSHSPRLLLAALPPWSILAIALGTPLLLVYGGSLWLTRQVQNSFRTQCQTLLRDLQDPFPPTRTGAILRNSAEPIAPSQSGYSPQTYSPQAYSPQSWWPEFQLLDQGIERLICQLHQRERLMESSATMYHLIFDLASIGMAVMSLDGHYLRVNRVLCKTLGYSEAELLARGNRDVTHPDDLAISNTQINRLLNEGLPYAQVRKRYLAKDGRTVHVLLKVALMYDAQEQPLSFLLQVVDLTRHRLAEMALQRAEERYQVLFENATEGIFQMTRDGYFISANPSLASMLGYHSPEELITSLTDVRRQLYVERDTWEQFMTAIEDQGEVTDFKVQVYRRDGSSLWILQNVHTVQDGLGNFLYYEGTVEDITAQKQAEAQILHSVLYDALTGLPNRVLFTTQLQEVLSSTTQASSPDGALLLLDVDRFKVINDSLGPIVGDQLLVELSDRLKGGLQAEDILARMGGDEFALLLRSVSSVDMALARANQIHTILHQPFYLNQQEFFVSTSIGIAPLAPSSGTTPYKSSEGILRDAELAMYHAKQQGRARTEVFNYERHINPWTQLQLETALRRSLERKELILMYQPIISIPSGAIAGFEALVRWRHPEWGTISPGDFIPMAEETGLILPLGLWVMHQACQQLRQWQDQGLVDASLKMAVNVSGRQLSQPIIVEQIRNILAETQISPQCLRVEITETDLMTHEDEVAQRLDDLKALGVNLCIDDFGTGYSSFSRLHRFPIDALKIDRSFVVPSRPQENNWEIIRTIVSLTEEMGIGAIAEGIETQEQLTQIQQTGCHLIQGFFFAQPLSPEDARLWLKHGSLEMIQRREQNRESNLVSSGIT